MLGLNISIDTPSDIIESIERVIPIFDLLLNFMVLLFVDVSPLQEELSKLGRCQSCNVIDAVQENLLLLIEGPLVLTLIGTLLKLIAHLSRVSHHICLYIFSFFHNWCDFYLMLFFNHICKLCCLSHSCDLIE